MRLMSIVEATPATGLGRLARSLAVAEALREQGHEVVLTGDLELPAAIAIAEESGEVVVAGDHSPVGLARVAEEHGAERVLVDCAAYPDGLADLLAARGVRTACFRDSLNGSHSATGVDLMIAPAWSPRLVGRCGGRWFGARERARLRAGAGGSAGGGRAPRGSCRRHGRSTAAPGPARRRAPRGGDVAGGSVGGQQRCQRRRPVRRRHGGPAPSGRGAVDPPGADPRDRLATGPASAGRRPRPRGVLRAALLLGGRVHRDTDGPARASPLPMSRRSRRPPMSAPRSGSAGPATPRARPGGCARRCATACAGARWPPRPADWSTAAARPASPSC